MKLNVLERLILLNVLPPTGDITSIKLLREVREEASFDEEENKALNFKQEEEGSLMWNQAAGSIEKDILIGEIVTELVKTALKKLDEEKKLTEDHISFYDKFMQE